MYMYMYLIPPLLLLCPTIPCGWSYYSILLQYHLPMYGDIHVFDPTTPITMSHNPMWLILLLPIAMSLWSHVLDLTYSLLLCPTIPCAWSYYSLLLCPHNPMWLILLLPIAMSPWSHVVDPTTPYCYVTTIPYAWSYCPLLLQYVPIFLCTCSTSSSTCTPIAMSPWLYNLLLISSWSYGVHVHDLTTLSPCFTCTVVLKHILVFLQEYHSMYQPWIASSTSLPVAKWRGCSLWMTWHLAGERLD